MSRPSARHGVAAAFDATVAIASVPPLVLTGYLGLVSAAGSTARSATRSAARRRPAAATASKPTDPRFVVAIPAHDEEAGIGRTLESCRDLDYPPDRFSVHVVADNCSDATASVVRRHGYTVHERHDPTQPGKGPALNWLHDRLLDSGEPFDVFVVVDADSSLDQGFLSGITERLGPDVAAVQGYYSVRDPEASPATSFRFAALAGRHLLRPLGRTRLGASCGLYGNGMAFRRDVFERHRWTNHLAEDAELQMELLLDGHLVAFAPTARLEAEMPTSLEHAASQNARWERGRIDLARRYVPTLARRSLVSSRHRVAHLDAIADHLTPPLSVLAAAHLGLGGLSALRSCGRSRVAPLTAVAHALAIGVLAAHTVAALSAAGAPKAHYRALRGAPRIIVWKVALWMRAARPGAPVEWTRTRRNVDEADA